MLTVPGATQPAALFIKHPLETSLSLSLLDIIMSSLISNGIPIGPLVPVVQFSACLVMQVIFKSVSSYERAANNLVFVLIKIFG